MIEQMTPEQIKAAIAKLMSDNGYYLDIAIVDQRSGLNLTQLLAEQWQYVIVAQVVKIAPNGTTATATQSTP